jgi:molecular chaperone DnaK (HSP70)
VRACEEALAAAALGWGGVDRVLLVGSSTGLSGVEARLRAVAGRPPDWLQSRHHETAIAYGAALVGGAAAIPRAVRSCSVGDLGFRVLDPMTRAESVRVVIPRNTPMPVRATSVFYSNRPDQRRMVFEVVRVSAGGDAESLGHFAYLIENPRKNHPLEVSLGYDPLGGVTVDARDPHTNREVRQEFGDAGPGPDSLAALADMVSTVRLLE